MKMVEEFPIEKSEDYILVKPFYFYVLCTLKDDNWAARCLSKEKSVKHPPSFFANTPFKLMKIIA